MIDGDKKCPLVLEEDVEETGVEAEVFAVADTPKVLAPGDLRLTVSAQGVAS